MSTWMSDPVLAVHITELNMPLYSVWGGGGYCYLYDYTPCLG